MIRIIHVTVIIIMSACPSIAFSLHAPIRGRYGPSYRNESPMHMSGHDFTADEVQEMEMLIMSLSLENDDDYRRKKVATLFAEELAKPNGHPNRFTELFDSVLMITGERVQNEAKTNAAQESNRQQPVEIKMDAEISEVVYISREKSTAELQLWAFIDMMVQSKTLVKKAMGELGSAGSFT